MFYLLMILPLFLAQLMIRTPPAISGLTIDSTIAMFGLPGYYPFVGELVFLSDSPECSFPNINLKNYIALLFIDFSCDFSKVILLAQSMGAIGMILVGPNDDLNFYMNSNQENGAKVLITAIAIKYSDGSLLEPYKNSGIWVTYSFNLAKSTFPVVQFFMSGNYTLDKVYGNSLGLAYQELGSNIFSFTPGISYVGSSAQGVDINSDCIENICIQGNEAVNGSSMLKNSFIIYDFYLSLVSNNYSTFFSFLSDLYSTCEFNYSESCINSVLSTYAQNLPFNIPSTFYAINTTLAPFYLINSVWVFWPSSIETSICLSADSPPAVCQTCNSSCSFNDFYSSTCNSACNISSCGYQNLTCINDNGCFKFMLPDDPNCISHLNGLSTSGIIAISILIPVFVIALIVIAVYLVCRRNQKKKENEDLKESDVIDNKDVDNQIRKNMNTANAELKDGRSSGSCKIKTDKNQKEAGHIKHGSEEENEKEKRKYKKEKAHRNSKEQKNELILKAVEFNNDIEHVGQPYCSIDSEVITNGEKIILLACGDIFHAECIKNWLEEPGREQKCPNCNRSLEGYKVLL